MTTATARWLAGVLLTVAALAVAAGFGIAAHAWRDTFAFTPVLLALAGVGAIVASHRPGNATGWLFLAEGLIGVVGMVGLAYASYAVRSGAPPAAASWGGLGGGFAHPGLFPAVSQPASRPGGAAAAPPLAVMVPERSARRFGSVWSSGLGAAW
jgi:hypothetical protein